ncbi:MAG: glycosyltransferase family 4 protein [Bacteroidales bacterium]|nr:glycosyltransferase family 4 protein [Bacteroidales bacterium]
MKIILYAGGNLPSSGTGGPLKIMDLIFNNSVSKNESYILSTKGLINRQLDKNKFSNNLNIKHIALNQLLNYGIIKQKTLAKLSSIKRDITIVKKLKKIRDEKYIVHNLYAGNSLGLTYYLKNNNKKHIVTFQSKGSIVNEINDSHNTSKDSLFGKYMFKQEAYVIKNANLITFPSFASFSLMRNSHPEIEFDKLNVKIIYNGINVSQISNILKRSERKLNDKLRIINVAQHIEQKQIDKTLLILKELKNTIDFEFVNIGDGRLLEKNIQLSKELGLNNKVKFLGKLPYEEVIKQLFQSDIFIMTSRDVIFDLITLEAMAVGLPVLVSADGGNLELIENNINGFLISPDKSSEIIKILTQLKNDFNFYKRISEKAKTTILEKYTVETMCNEYYKIYEELDNMYYAQ